MPPPDRKNLSILSDIVDEAKSKWNEEKEDNETFISWITRYLKLSMKRDKLIQNMLPNIEIFTIKDNVLYLQDKKNDTFIKVKLGKNCIELSEDNKEYLMYAASSPDIARLSMKN